MPLSLRYVPEMIALLALALIPVALHSYAEVHSDECAEPRVLISDSSMLRASDRRDVVRRLAASQYREGRVHGENGEPPLSFVILRSYDAKRLYYRFAHRLSKETPASIELDWLDGDPPLPIRRVVFATQAASAIGAVGADGAEAAYLLVYDGEPVANAYWNQLLAAPKRLLTGNRPMTAFYVRAQVPLGEDEAIRQRLDAWLRESWERYRTICFPS